MVQVFTLQTVKSTGKGSRRNIVTMHTLSVCVRALVFLRAHLMRDIDVMGYCSMSTQLSFFKQMFYRTEVNFLVYDTHHYLICLLVKI